MPGVFRHEEPFAPLPLVMHANAPEVSFAAQVCPVGHVKGSEAHPSVDELAVDEEHATTP
jgi:hypothetical protein